MYFGGFPDLWLYSRPNYARSRSRTSELSFPEAIFSFVFGDGDPNQDSYEEGRWRALGQFIQLRNGVVTAEEMAPFLDPPIPNEDSVSGTSGLSTDDSYILPALIKFGGEPFVDEEGHLLYRFPSFQRTVVQRVRSLGRSTGRVRVCLLQIIACQMQNVFSKYLNSISA